MHSCRYTSITQDEIRQEVQLQLYTSITQDEIRGLGESRGPTQGLYRQVYTGIYCVQTGIYRYVPVLVYTVQTGIYLYKSEYTVYRLVYTGIYLYRDFHSDVAR